MFAFFVRLFIYDDLFFVGLWFQGDHLTVSDASGNNEWKAFSTSS